ncbi:MAG: hypothetical protein WD768_12675 [Phycisphaeraceae bacterium]
MRNLQSQISILFLTFALGSACAFAQVKNPTEADYYPMTRFTLPEGEVIEPGGIELMPDGKLAVGTRRGEIWMIENPFGDADKMKYTRWAAGLHEILGLVQRDGWLYITQRPEITKAKDIDGDGRGDLFLTVSDDWEISGDYHEYNFGSRFDKEGNMWFVCCLTGSFSSSVPYRGWAVRVSADGKFTPTTSGVRSPGGIGFGPNGDVFYCDNQGPWNGTSSLKQLVPGHFVGHPGGFQWYNLPEVKAAMGPRLDEPKSKSRFHIERERLPKYIPPAILLPHGKVGNSASTVLYDDSNGKFGPFKGQMFLSDQSHSNMVRCNLEKIDGLYQGACFMFRTGFGSGNVPGLFTRDGHLFIGGTARGWGARGGKPFAMDRVDWNGKVPFEVHEMRIKHDGFEFTFTKPVDKATASDLKSYAMKTWTYIFQADYGSPEVDHTTPTIKSATVAPDGLSVRLIVDGLQIGHIHELTMKGLKAAGEGLPLLHDVGWYTLWNIPKK